MATVTPAPTLLPPPPLPTLDPQGLWARFGDEIIAGAVNIAAAIAILLVGLWLAGAAAKGVRAAAARSSRIDNTLAAFLAQVVRYALLAVVVLAVLGRFGVETTSIVAMLGAATLAVGLALQGTLSNVAAGVMLVMFRPYRIGDFVQVAGETGVVQEVALFTTTLDTFDGVRVTLPNGVCWGAAIRNFSTLPHRRVEIVFGVSYDTDLNHAIAVIHEELAAHPCVLVEPEPMVKVNGLGDFSVNILTYAWTKNSDWFQTGLDLHKNVKEAFDAHGIVIPFPTSLNYEIWPKGGATTAAKPPVREALQRGDGGPSGDEDG